MNLYYQNLHCLKISSDFIFLNIKKMCKNASGFLIDNTHMRKSFPLPLPSSRGLLCLCLTPFSTYSWVSDSASQVLPRFQRCKVTGMLDMDSGLRNHVRDVKIHGKWWHVFLSEKITFCAKNKVKPYLFLLNSWDWAVILLTPYNILFQKLSPKGITHKLGLLNR